MSVSAEPARASSDLTPARRGARTAVATVCLSGTLEDKLARPPRPPASTASRSSSPTSSPSPSSGRRDPSALRGPRPHDRPLPALPRLRLHRPATPRGQPAARRAQVRRHGGAGHRPGPRLLLGVPGRRRRRRPDRRAAARPGRAGGGARTARVVRGAGVGTPRQHLRAVVGDRAPRRPPGTRAVRRQLPHPLPRQRPRRDPRHPGREAVLPAARRRTAPGHGRAAVEPPPPALPRPGRLRPAGVPRPCARRRLHRTAVARGVQRRLPTGRPAARGGRRPALAARARRGDARPSWPTTPRGTAFPPDSGAAPPFRRHLACTASRFAELAVDDDCERGGRAHPRSARLRPRRPHRTKPVQLWSHGRRPGAAQRPGAAGRPRTAPRSPRSESRSTIPRRPSQRADGAARPAATPHPRTGRGGPVRRRRPGRHGGVLLPHRRPRTAGSPTSRPMLPELEPTVRPRARRSATSTTSRSRSRSTTSTRRRCSTAACWGWSTQHASEVAAPVRPGPQPDRRRPRP